MKTLWPLIFAITALLVVGTITPCAAQAPTPVGFWEGTSSLETTPLLGVYVPQKICFLANGTFMIENSQRFTGRWFQRGVGPNGNGLHVRAFASNSAGKGNYALELDFFDFKTLSGTMTQWMDSTTAGGLFLRLSLTRTSEVCPPPQP